MRRERYWEREEVRKRRMCGWKRKDWEHVWEKCWSGRRANCGDGRGSFGGERRGGRVVKKIGRVKGGTRNE